jgi:3-deoxy-D-manno-octulosonic-acid transferase
MQWIYGIIIRLYYFSILVVSPFHSKAKAWLIGRKNLQERLRNAIQGQKNLIWIHCSSLGEFEQGRPVIEEYRRRNSDQKILLTFFSPSGYEIRKNYQGADWIFYMPLDIRSNVKWFLEIVQPQKVIFVKYEFWYNFLNALKQKNIPVYLISAVFRKEQLFFKWYGGWYRKILGFFTHIFIQNENSFDLLKSINVHPISIAGDTRFDRVYEIAENGKEIPEAVIFSKGSKIIVGGSTWPEDEEILIPFINKQITGVKFIIAQHEISENRLSKFEKSIESKVVRFSKATASELENAQVLLIDNIGMLSSLYKYGKIAYIGGGFGKGIHNILEAAVYGLPVFFGPNYQKFAEANELISQKGAFSITDYKEFSERITLLLNDTEYYKRTSLISKNYVVDRTGATQKIFSVLDSN